MKYVLSIIFLCLFAHLFAQTYDVIGNFKSDTTYTVQFRRAKIDSEDSLTGKVFLETEVAMSFESLEGDKVCKWEYGNTTPYYEGVSFTVDEEYDELINAYKGMQIELLLDQNSQFIAFLNFKETKDAILKWMLEKSDLLTGDSVDNSKADMEMIVSYLEPTMSSPEVLLNTYFPEVLLSFRMYGYSFEVDHDYEEIEMVQFPFSSELFPVETYYEVVENEHDITIYWDNYFDTEDISKIIEETAEGFDVDADSIMDMISDVDFDMDSEAEYVYDLSLEVFVYIYYEKYVYYEKSEQMLILEIDLIRD
jgi:hypothetical protein